MKGNYQRLTLTPLLTSTVDTTYCDVVLVACHKTSEQCNTSGVDVQKSPIGCLGIVGGNVDISTVSKTQGPSHSDIDSSIDISREANTGEGRDGR